MTNLSLFFELEIENETEDNFYIWEMFYETEAQQKISITSLDNKTDNILPDETQTREKIFMRCQKGRCTSAEFIFCSRGFKSRKMPRK